MKYLPPFALTLVVAALLIVNFSSYAHTDAVTMAPLSERAAIAVWCARHDQTPGPPSRTYLLSCTETNTP